MLVALILSPAALRLSRRLGLLDVPGSSSHKMHSEATPMGGGIVIAGALLISAVWFQWLRSEQILGILLAAAVILAFGLWDDEKGLGAPLKLFGQGLAALILIMSGTQVLLFSNSFANIALTVLWVVGIINAFNFVDSMDGLAVGVGGIAAAFFMIVTVESGQPELSALSAAILGISLGLYLFNVMPARIFLGDSGSQLLGLLLAAIGVAYNPAGLERLSSWFVPILVLGIPIFDTSLVVLSRVRSRRPIYKAGRDHTYHRMVRLGMAPSQAVAVMHVATVAVGIVAFLALGSGVVIANLIFGTVLVVAVGLITFFEVKAVGS
jgi:UDP-GlcNAc:undecaprenyl-phosphate GlcNAc-1-phosphate transferase